MAVSRILRFSLTSADLSGLAQFYAAAFGFVPVGAVARVDASLYGAAGVAQRLRLGDQDIELVRFDTPGAPYPAGSTSHDAWFQHLAIVTDDMVAAHARLSAQPGWTSLTRDGTPVLLPASSGGVTAFKFRDPEGHSLELLQFPGGTAWPPGAAGARRAGPCLGIDHSAVVVSDVVASLAFYDTLGLRLTARSENRGIEQDRLDNIREARVSVVGLSPQTSPPHLELLAYHTPPVTPGSTGPTDVACTRTILAAGEGDDTGLHLDPNGHRMILVR